MRPAPISERPGHAVARIVRWAALAAVAVLVAAASASADSIGVEDPGSVRLDLGQGTPSRTVHVVLRSPGDLLTATLQPPKDTQRTLDVLIPDHEPERSAVRSALPRLELRDAGGTRRIVPLASFRSVVDEATGLRYLRIARVTDIGAAAWDRTPRTAPRLTVLVRRGSVPTRAALRISGGEPFAIDDTEGLRRTLGAVQQWHDIPADPDVVPRNSDMTRGRSTAAVVVPAALAAAMALLAIWWILRGRARARRGPGTV